MADLITYADKSDSQVIGTPADQKVSAVDMNEIKNVTNQHAGEIESTIPNPTALVDGASISFNFDNKYVDLKTLTTSTTTITLTLSNVIAGANQLLSVIKNTAGDVTITLAGTGLSFYGYEDANYSSTPDIILSGASGNIYDISLFARTATQIGVAIGQNGN